MRAPTVPLRQFGVPMDQAIALSFLADVAPRLSLTRFDQGTSSWTTLAVGLLLGLGTSVGLLIRQGRLRRELGAAISRLAQGDYQRPFESARGRGFEELRTGLDTLAKVLSERKRSVEQSEQLLHMIIDAAPMAILLLEDAGDIEYANETARNLFFEGRPVGKKNFLALLEEAPSPLREAVLDVQDRFFAVEQAGNS